MTETISLRNETEFVRITDEDESFYGGDQIWFHFTVGQYSGCGTVAAANITAYLAAEHASLRGLCAMPDLEKKSFQAHMIEIYNWVKPWKLPFVSENRPSYRSFGWGLGIWPPCRFARGVERYARSKEICLTDRRISSRRSMEELIAFIRDSLDRDCPVAMLIGKKPRYDRNPVIRPDGFTWRQLNFALHWVVITMLTISEESVMVKVSTWGGYSWLDLEAWHRAGGVMPELVSFEWTNEA